MKKILSLLCVFAIVLGVNAVPAKQTQLQSAKMQTMKLQQPAQKAPLGKTISPRTDKDAFSLQTVPGSQTKTVKPQAQKAQKAVAQKAVSQKAVAPKAAAPKAARQPKFNLQLPHRAQKADSTEFREFNVAEAIAAVDANEVLDGDDIAVHGIITKMQIKGKNFSNYGSVCIYVADAYGNEGEFEFYNCYSFDGARFETTVPDYDSTSTAWLDLESVTDIYGTTVSVGNEIVARGNFKKYNSTYELNTGCYIIYLKNDDDNPYSSDANEDIEINFDGVSYYESVEFSEGSFYHIVQAINGDKLIGLMFVNGSNVIEDGTYTIESSLNHGIVMSSQGSGTYSLIATITDNGLAAPAWYLISGTVTVQDGVAYVDALNSKGRSIKASIVLDIPEPISSVPSDAVLANYYTPGDVCVCFFVPADMNCNDIVLTGSFNGWSSNVADCAPVEPVDGYDGWYVASFEPEAEPDPERGIQAKPIMLDVDGNFNWEYQIGAATVIRGGVEVVWGAYAGEIDMINYGTDAPNVFTVDAWKQNPCTAKYHNYTITVVSDGCDGSVVPFLVGSMTNWAFTQMPLNANATAENMAPTYSISFKAPEGSEFQLVSGVMDSETGEIIILPEWSDDAYMQEKVGEEWIRINGGANFILGEIVELVYDLRAENLRWARCSEESVETVIFGVKFPTENCPEAIDVIGSFDGWTGTALEFNASTGWYVSFDIHAKASDCFKFRSAGSWDQELLIYDAENDEWRYITDYDFIFGQLWWDDTWKGEPVKWIELDLSDPDHYRWNTPFSPTGDTIRIDITEPMMRCEYYNGSGDWYLVGDNGNKDYRVFIDVINNNPISPAGTYTTENLYSDFTRVFRYENDSMGYNYFAVEATIYITDENNRIDVYASLLCDDGNVYEITMFKEKAEPLVPTRTENIVVEDANLNILSGAWQITGWNPAADRYVSIAAYSDVIAGDYITNSLAIGYCYVGERVDSATINWFDASEAQFSVAYDETTTVATVDGWMVAVSETNGEVVQFNIYLTTAAQPTGKQYDAEDTDFIVDFAEYEIYDAYLADYGVLFIDAFNENNEAIELEVWLPEGATELVPGIYPVAAEGNLQTVTEGAYDGGLYGSFAYILNDEGYITVPLWFLTEGQVYVNEDGSIYVDALNSYGRAIRSSLAKPHVEIHTCAEAAEAALSVSANNELFNDGQIFTIPGYVTEISTAWSAQYKNITFWMADTKDGGRVIQAYRAACATEEDAPKVGDYIQVTGALTRYNNTPEFAAGSTFEILQRDVNYCGDNLTWTLANGVLTIEGTGAMWSEMYTQWGWEYNQVILPEGLTSIGAYAFYNSYNLTSIQLPSTLEEIGYAAFAYSGLQSLEIPANVTWLDSYAFAYIYALIDLRVKGNGISVYNTTFTGSQNIQFFEGPVWMFHGIQSQILNQVVITCGEPTNTHINNLLLSHKTLEKIDLRGMEGAYIPDEMLRNCYNLIDVKLPQNLLAIGDGAFNECKSLRSIAIPAAVVRIGSSAFENCRSLNDIQFANNSQLQSIGNWAFYNCHDLTEIQLPQGVTEIGDGAFYGCVFATQLSLPASVVTIGDNAFALCSKLDEIHVNAVLPPDIMAKTFYEVSRETPVYVPEESIDIYKNHIYWGELNIIDTRQGIEGVGAEGKAHKIVRDGQILIIRGDRTFTTTGAEVK